MKKKLEKIGDPLFRPLTAAHQKRVHGGVTQTSVTARETANPNPDFTRDGDQE
jgi:hypothetical protein